MENNGNSNNGKQPVKQTKIKKSFVITTVVALVFVVFATLYFKLLLPMLNVLYNPIKPDDPANSTFEKPTIDSGLLIDPDNPYFRPTAAPEETPEITPGETPDPNGTPEVTETPGETPVYTETPTPDPEATPTPYNGEEGFDIDQAITVKASKLVFEEGTKNVLLLGFNKDDGLADSIFVLNINPDTKVMKLISIPRDAYVPYSKATLDAMKSAKVYSSLGSHKINFSYYIGNYVVHYVGGQFGNSGLDFLCAIISALLPGCEIDDYVYVDFMGFMDVIDVFGGVYITAPEDFYTDTGELVIKKGVNKLNSREALYYVRARKRYDSTGHNTGKGSDDWRKLNQTNFIMEVATQVVTKENMTVSKVMDTMDVLKKSVFHSITPDKLPYYLSVGRDFADKKYKVYSYVISGTVIDPLGDHTYYVLLD